MTTEKFYSEKFEKIDTKNANKSTEKMRKKLYTETNSGYDSEYDIHYDLYRLLEVEDGEEEKYVYQMRCRHEITTLQV